MKTGDWYDAKAVEDTIDGLTETAGTFGYAFADVTPEFRRNPEDLTMDVTYTLKDAGQTLDQAKAAKPLAGMSNAPNGFVADDAFVEAIWNSLPARAT